jgi:hypothetical protein
MRSLARDVENDKRSAGNQRQKKQKGSSSALFFGATAMKTSPQYQLKCAALELQP